MIEKVNHPLHYRFLKPAHEMADLTIEMPHALGSAMEYLWRAGKKPGADAIDDLRKAVWWIEREISELEDIEDADIDEIDYIHPPIF